MYIHFSCKHTHSYTCKYVDRCMSICTHNRAPCIHVCMSTFSELEVRDTHRLFLLEKCDHKYCGTNWNFLFFYNWFFTFNVNIWTAVYAGTCACTSVFILCSVVQLTLLHLGP